MRYFVKNDILDFRKYERVRRLADANTKKPPDTQSGIYHLVYREGPLARPEIGRRLGVSLPTAMQGVKALVERGLLEEGEALASTGGRKAVGIQCAANARAALGIDVTKNHVSMAVINLQSEILAHHRQVLPFAPTRAYWDEVGRLAAALKAESGLDEGLFLGTGISIPGVVDGDGQTLVYSHVLRETALHVSSLVPALGSRVVLCNDANAAGIAEMWGQGTEHPALYLSLSNSVGGAVVFQNLPLPGHHSRCGEFGHTTLVPGGRPCYCGQLGCMDAYCNAALLSRHTGGDLRLFFQQLQQGDPTLAAAWREYLEWLAIAVNNLLTGYDSPVILGGYLGEYLEPYLPDLRRLVAARSTFSGGEEDIRACRYKKAAAPVGAALLWVAPFLDGI